MPDSISLTFLGTAAGRPSTTRNVSSLALKLDAKVWVFDAGEGTQHQLMDKRCQGVPMGKVERIFVTHMHADHVNGLPGLLCTISAGEGSVQPGTEDPRLKEAQSIPPTQIYGPSGLRLFLRTCLALTHSTLTRPYVVHELLFPDEPVERGALHPSERRGRDIRCEADGFWRGVVRESEAAGVRVDVGPILHTVRCLGYLVVESPRPLPINPALYIPHLKNPSNAADLASQGFKNPMRVLSHLQTSRTPVRLADGTTLDPPPIGGRGRRILILGDTYDASPVVPLVEELPRDDEAEAGERGEAWLDLVVHESTNAYLPLHDPSQHASKLRPDGSVAHSLESVTRLAREHGHSTPQVAGSFAKRVRTERLVLNHLSVKYPDPGDETSVVVEGPDEEGREDENKKAWRGMLGEIERQAREAFLGSETELTEVVDGRDRGHDPEADAGGARGRDDWRVKTARDFMRIDVPRRDKVAVRDETAKVEKSKR